MFRRIPRYNSNGNVGPKRREIMNLNERAIILFSSDTPSLINSTVKDCPVPFATCFGHCIPPLSDQDVVIVAN